MLGVAATGAAMKMRATTTASTMDEGPVGPVPARERCHGLRYLEAAETRRHELVAWFGEAAVDEIRQMLQYFFAPGAGQIGDAVTIRKARQLTRQDGHRLGKDHP